MFVCSQGRDDSRKQHTHPPPPPPPPHPYIFLSDIDEVHRGETVIEEYTLRVSSVYRLSYEYSLQGLYVL